ncbi:MAG: hypothetical protein AAB403_20250 [Planctomycetota bacterium]
MHIYCEKCRKQQAGSERTCSQCGTPYGGQLWFLLMGIALAGFLPALVLTSGQDVGSNGPKILFWYVLPVAVGTATVYDYHPRRRAIYLWGGVSLIVGSMFLLL